MSTIIHFIDVGQGNMVLIQCQDGTNFMVDCNITEDNQGRVLRYVAEQIGRNTRLNGFICSHRDTDHIRGIAALHKNFPIRHVFDSGYPGTTTDSGDYRTYMAIRRQVGYTELAKGVKGSYGRTRLEVLSAQDKRLPKNANAQGIVLKVEHKSPGPPSSTAGAILPGDSDTATWKHGILRDYNLVQLSCDIFMAAHHGSMSFFEDPDNSQLRYTRHMLGMKPDMVIVSVGKNPYGHPEREALVLYAKHSNGSNRGNKVFRTDKQGTIKLTLTEGGGWRIVCV